MKSSSNIPRIAYRTWEAAEALGVSEDWLEEHVLPFIRWYREDRMKLIPVAELDRWLKENSRMPSELLGAV